MVHINVMFQLSDARLVHLLLSRTLQYHRVKEPNFCVLAPPHQNPGSTPDSEIHFHLQVTPIEPWVYKEWKENQSLSRKPVKVTIPGPMTIIGSTASRSFL